MHVSAHIEGALRLGVVLRKANDNPYARARPIASRSRSIATSLRVRAPRKTSVRAASASMTRLVTSGLAAATPVPLSAMMRGSPRASSIGNPEPMASVTSSGSPGVIRRSTSDAPPPARMTRCQERRGGFARKHEVPRLALPRAPRCTAPLTRTSPPRRRQDPPRAASSHRRRDAGRRGGRARRGAHPPAMSCVRYRPRSG